MDPGSGWDVAGVTNATKDHTLRRKSPISFGNGGDWASSAGTTAEDSEWIVLDNDYALNNDLEGYNSHDFTALCASTTEGCTDPFAINYDPNATVDDGSCLFIPNVTIQEINQGLTTGIVTTTGIVMGVYLTDDGCPSGGLHHPEWNRRLLGHLGSRLGFHPGVHRQRPDRR